MAHRIKRKMPWPLNEVLMGVDDKRFPALVIMGLDDQVSSPQVAKARAELYSNRNFKYQLGQKNALLLYYFIRQAHFALSLVPYFSNWELMSWSKLLQDSVIDIIS